MSRSIRRADTVTITPCLQLLQLQRRVFYNYYSSKAGQKWSIKQVSKSNFLDSMDDFKNRLSDSDFVALSMQNTGSFSAPWHRVLPFDTSDTAYCKAKSAAERFQLFQFAVCPFSFRASNLVAYPFNFQLFPRDELKMGMPSYSFSCQILSLTSMAHEGFDFNACINDGMSYLSRAQESVAKLRMGSPIPNTQITKSSTPTVADKLFIERIKSRISHWKKACNLRNNTNEPLLSSLRKLALEREKYGSRPCLNVDVCSERQAQLILEMLPEFSDDLVPLMIPAKGGGSKAIHVILTSSKEDKDLFERELQHLEDEKSKKIHGFREVIDMISASGKPVVSYDSLNDFTFIHSKFLAPLPPTLDEFACSLHSVFPRVLDIRHLMRDIGPRRIMTNMTSAFSYLNNHFVAPVGIEIPEQAMVSEGKIHGHNVLKICHLFAKVCSVLKLDPSTILSTEKHFGLTLEEYTTSPNESVNGDSKVGTSKAIVSSERLVFVWGCRDGMTAQSLKSLLRGSHDVFREDFDVRFVNKSCAIVVFRQPGLSETFLDAINSAGVSGYLKELVSRGLRATSYKTYDRVCKLGSWETDLAEALEKALGDPNFLPETDTKTSSSEVYCFSESHA